MNDLQDFPSLVALGDELARAADRDARALRSPRRLPRRSLAVALAGALAIAGTAAAGTLLLLRGSVIPAPDERVVGPAQSPVPGSSKVAPFRAVDPGGAPPWTLRVARSKTGLSCTTVGQVVGGKFGLVGLDGRFRTLAEGVVDGCGQVAAGSALIGARVFDAKRRSDVRTVVAGDAGPALRDVTVTAGGRRYEADRAADGTFAVALAGYPEDLALTVTMRFADGRTERHAFGHGPFVVPDPAGGRAWKLEAGQLGQPLGTPAPAYQVVCVQFRPARNVLNPAISPGACGRITGAKAGSRTENGLFFAIQRIQADHGRTRYEFGRQLWHRHQPRTAAWGFAGTDIRSVSILGPDGERAMTLTPGRLFLAIYPPSVDPATLRVHVVRTDGNEQTFDRSHGLVPPPGSNR